MTRQQRLELLQRMRRDWAIIIAIYVSLAMPLFAICLKLTWGNGGATFIVCLVTFYGLYHLVDGIKHYRLLKDEETRLRRANEVVGEE